jgi:hypothetical protein
MLFLVSWKPRTGLDAQAGERGFEIFTRWKPPQGLDIKAMYFRADHDGGICVCEASSAEIVFEATAPWGGAYLDYDIVPIVATEKAVELQKKGIAFRKG